MRSVLYLIPVLAMVSCVLLVGCGSETSSADAPIEIAGLPPEIGDGHNDGHNHSHEGPHGGHIIELGRKHEYHAELVERHDTETVSIYILDQSMHEVPIESREITMHVTVNGKPESFTLVAVNSVGGKSSRFDARDKMLLHTLEHNSEVIAKLRVTIDGRPFVGRLAHRAHGAHQYH